MATAELIPNTEATETATKLEVVVRREDLVAELAAVMGAVETKTTIPILSSLLFDASTPDAPVRIAATNLSQSIETSVGANIKTPGKAAIPARKLYDYVRLLSGKEIAIKQEDNFYLQIRCGRSKTRMVGMSPAAFPLLPGCKSMEDGFSASMLQKFITSILVSVAPEEGRYSLNGALLIVSSEELEMVSTDGHRLTRIRGDIGTIDHASRKLLIPRAALIELKALLKTVDSGVSIGEDESHYFFGAGHRTFASRKLTGQFPKYEAIMPKGYAPGIMLDIPSVSQALDRCLLFSDDKSRAVRMDIEEKTLKISSACANVGSSEESLDIVGGPQKAMAIGYNGDYIRDLLEMVPEHLEFQFKDGNSAVIFTHRCAEDESTLEYVVMPMRLGDGK